VLEGGQAVFYVFVSGFPMTLVGAVLTLSPRILYPTQTGTGPGALAAQQLAGVLMWIVSAAITLGISAVLVIAWLHGMERTNPSDSALPSPIPPPLPVAGPTTPTRTPAAKFRTSTKGKVAR
jgi:cytochrome c oxidase assembly factor CtaG